MQKQPRGYGACCRGRNWRQPGAGGPEKQTEGQCDESVGKNRLPPWFCLSAHGGPLDFWAGTKARLPLPGPVVSGLGRGLWDKSERCLRRGVLQEAQRGRCRSCCSCFALWTSSTHCSLGLHLRTMCCCGFRERALLHKLARLGQT